MTSSIQSQVVDSHQEKYFHCLGIDKKKNRLHYGKKKNHQ